jgi:hypothetical protein
MTVKRFVAAAFVIGLGLALGSCSSFSDTVSDHWPHFAGGEPDDLPPRPGTPGYDAFIAHGQAQQGQAQQGQAQQGTPAGNAQPAAPGATASTKNPNAGAADQVPSAFTDPLPPQGQQPGAPLAPGGARSGSNPAGLY